MIVMKKNNRINQKAFKKCSIKDHPDINKYILKSKIPPIPEMSNYILKTEIPIVEQDELQNQIEKALEGFIESGLKSGYVKKLRVKKNEL